MLGNHRARLAPDENLDHSAALSLCPVPWRGNAYGALLTPNGFRPNWRHGFLKAAAMGVPYPPRGTLSAAAHNR